VVIEGKIPKVMEGNLIITHLDIRLTHALASHWRESITTRLVAVLHAGRE